MKKFFIIIILLLFSTSSFSSSHHSHGYKKNKEMAFTWSVVVKEEIVRLFCPACMKKAKDLINKGEINGT